MRILSTIQKLKLIKIKSNRFVIIPKDKMDYENCVDLVDEGLSAFRKLSNVI